MAAAGTRERCGLQCSQTPTSCHYTYTWVWGGEVDSGGYGVSYLGLNASPAMWASGPMWETKWATKAPSLPKSCSFIWRWEGEGEGEGKGRGSGRGEGK